MGGWIHIFYAKAAKNSRSNKNTFTYFFYDFLHKKKTIKICLLVLVFLLCHSFKCFINMVELYAVIQGNFNRTLRSYTR